MKNILSLILGMVLVLGVSSLAKADVDICSPESFRGLSFTDISIKVLDWVLNSPGTTIYDRVFKWEQLHTDFLGQSCDEDGNTPLHRAINEAVSRVHPNIRLRLAYQRTISRDIVTRREATFAAGIDSSHRIHRPAHIHQPSLAFVHALVNKNAPLDAVNSSGQTPLDLVKSLMGAEDLSEDQFDLYAFIYQTSSRSVLTEEQKEEHIFQRLCRTEYNRDQIVNPPAVRQLQSMTWEKSPILKDADYAVERLAYRNATETVIDEYNQWLRGRLNHARIEDIPVLMDIYGLFHKAAIVSSSSSEESVWDRLSEDAHRCSGFKGPYVSLNE